jgi:hypothetical protein
MVMMAEPGTPGVLKETSRELRAIAISRSEVNGT